MSKKPIAVQLYTMREALAQDFEGAVRQLAQIGYLGVETAGFPDGVTAADASQLFQDLNLSVSGAHAPLPLGDNQNEVLDQMAALGCTRLICPYLPPESYQSLDQIKRNCDLLNEANTVAAANGLSLGVHNHWWEFMPVDGVYPYQVWQEELDPTIFFEIDAYWVKTAGCDPISILQSFHSRTPLLHVKDGPATQDAPMVAVGDGDMDYASIIAAVPEVEWLVVELDRCASDMLTAVTRSYTYLIEKGLAYGNKN